MIPWQDTAEPRVQVRKHYGTIPVAPGQHIVGWEVRVWWDGAYWALHWCNTCKKRCDLREVKLTEKLRERPDFRSLEPSKNNGWMWVPYAHECSAPVPWAARRPWPSEGWQQPHHHPKEFPLRTEMSGVHDERATPVLYSSAQLAYCAGLELLGIEPRHHHWIPPAPALEPRPRCLNLRSA